MTREEKITKMVDQDVDDIVEDISYERFDFLESVLRGEGWIPYNQLTDEQIDIEYAEREFEDE